LLYVSPAKKNMQTSFPYPDSLYKSKQRFKTL
jgi:hypothetical protein